MTDEKELMELERADDALALGRRRLQTAICILAVMIIVCVIWV